MGDLSKHFNRSEFACRCGCGFDTVDYKLVVNLEMIRVYFNEPVIIDSGCRCKRHNHAVGGQEDSQHLRGKAADFIVKGFDPEFVQEKLIKTFVGEYGIGSYPNFTHFDVRDGEEARW